MKKKHIKIPKNFFKDLKYEVNVPTFKCSCGEKVLDTPTNRLQSEVYNHQCRLTQ